MSSRTTTSRTIVGPVTGALPGGARVVDAYLAELESHLADDPALARRVRDEFADHFAEMLDDDADEAAARRAVARMGAVRVIAARFVADGAGHQAERTWWVLLAALVATFTAMRLRTLWLPAADADGPLAGLIAPAVDRWAFVAALAAGALGYWLARPAAGSLSLTRTMTPRRAAGVAALVSLGAVGASVIAGLVRIGAIAGWTGAPAGVVAATAVEVLLLAVLLCQALALRRRLKRAGALAAG